jgi:hypothetical protein
VFFSPAASSYHAAISQGMTAKQTACRGEPHVRQFGYDFLRGLGIAPRAESTCRGGGDAAGAAPGVTNVLFVRRVHYKAHPRHNGKIVRRLDNEDAIYAALEAAAPAQGLALLNGLFSSMSLRQQVEMMQAACVVTGAHGAGLSHILFAPRGEAMLELQPPGFQRPHFIAYTHWADSAHEVWVLSDSTPNPGTVVARIVEAAKKTKAS